jgi:hypothetical protein
MAVVRSVVRRIVPVYVRSRVHFALVDGPFSEVFAALDPSKQTRITADTKLIIEGCPRSGNSYALAAFLHANGRDVPVVSHRHSPTSVKAGLRRGIPVIVIIRHPRPTIASGLQYYPDQPPKWAVQVYRRFHQRLLPLADQVLIATFEEVISDFGEVVRRCNRRYGTDFVPYERTDASEQAVKEMVDQWALANFTQDELPRISGHPSPVRRSADEVLAGLSKELQAEIDELDKLYNAVLLHQ